MMTIHVEANPGDTIDKACCDALALSCRLGAWIVFDFNGRHISVQPCNTVAQLVAAFHAKPGLVICGSAPENWREAFQAHELGMFRRPLGYSWAEMDAPPLGDAPY